MSKMSIGRRALFGFAALLPLVGGPPSAAQDGRGQPVEVPDATNVTAEDHVLGQADAPVTIIEYASLTCPFCAQFHATTLPRIKQEFVDTGKARYVFRDFPLDRLALTAALVARCAERDRYFSFLDVLFGSQSSWARSDKPIQALMQVAKFGNLSETAVEACFKDEARLNAILQQRLGGERTFRVSSTPTLVVNGRVVAGGHDYDALKRAIEAVLPRT